jgi:hypothetical protein
MIYDNTNSTVSFDMAEYFVRRNCGKKKNLENLQSGQPKFRPRFEPSAFRKQL